MLDEQTVDASESIQQLFYYYMFYLRAAVDKNYDTTIQGARKYYSDKSYKRLFSDDLMDNLFLILNIWKVVNQHSVIENESWSENTKIIKTLDIMSSYPNEYWKYPVVIFYLTHRSETGFESDFEAFLKKLLAELLTKYLVTPTVNAVKSDILKLNVEITNTAHPKFDFKDVDETLLKSNMKTPHKNAVRMLLKILAYDEQDTILPAQWEIEHILPQKWQSAYFIESSDEVIREKSEHIGNKLPFEKKLNIIAGNGYFDKKKKEYADSVIVITKEFSSTPLHDWKLDDITERDVRVVDSILTILGQWNEQYKTEQPSNTSKEPTDEERVLIEKFKSKGWI